MQQALMISQELDELLNQYGKGTASKEQVEDKRSELNHIIENCTKKEAIKAQ